MPKCYKTPTGRVSSLFIDVLQQSHVLIAGATGSGKSVFVNGLIRAALFDAPSKTRLILIDPKGTELDQYKDLPHVIQYAQTPDECIKALEDAADITRARFEEMKRQHVKTYRGSDIYIIIDELMYLMNRKAVKRRIFETLQDLLIIARAARVHVIACPRARHRLHAEPDARHNPGYAQMQL